MGAYFSPPRNFRSQTWTAVPGMENYEGEKNSWTPEITGGGLKQAPTVIFFGEVQRGCLFWKTTSELADSPYA